MFRSDLPNRSRVSLVKVGIVGGSGYAGGEIARLLDAHPNFEVETITGNSSAGQILRDFHPNLLGLGSRVIERTTLDSLRGHDLIVLALPHGKSGQLGEELISQKEPPLLVDLGADRRLINATDWDSFYGGQHFAPFICGMPELRRTEGPSSRELISSASSLSVPGCNATAVTLALMPLLSIGAIAPHDVNVALAVGASGAGRVARTDLLAAELNASAIPYSIGGTHRHLPEIRQNLFISSGKNVSLTLSAVLVPMSRGILATVSGLLDTNMGLDEIHSEVLKFYAEDEFVTVLPLGKFPRTGDVFGSNSLQLGLAFDPSVNRVLAVAAIDNLGKGAAGAALQAINLACGLPEKLGLNLDGVHP